MAEFHLNIPSSRIAVLPVARSPRSERGFGDNYSSTNISTTNRFEILSNDHKNQQTLIFMESRKKTHSQIGRNICKTLLKFFLRRKRYSLQVIKQFIMFADESSSSILPINLAGHLQLNQQILHEVAKVYETKETQGVIWAFLNLKLNRVEVDKKQCCKIMESTNQKMQFKLKQFAFIELFLISPQIDLKKSQMNCQVILPKQEQSIIEPIYIQHQPVEQKQIQIQNNQVIERIEKIYIPYNFQNGKQYHINNEGQKKLPLRKQNMFNQLKQHNGIFDYNFSMEKNNNFDNNTSRHLSGLPLSSQTRQYEKKIQTGKSLDETPRRNSNDQSNFMNSPHLMNNPNQGNNLNYCGINCSCTSMIRCNQCCNQCNSVCYVQTVPTNCCYEEVYNIEDRLKYLKNLEKCLKK